MKKIKLGARMLSVLMAAALMMTSVDMTTFADMVSDNDMGAITDYSEDENERDLADDADDELSDENDASADGNSADDVEPCGAVALPQILPSMRSGDVRIALKGTYFSAGSAAVLKEINRIRKEACDKGYPNPSGSGKLKPSDYKPIKWSAEMEAIARIRAAEASVFLSHERPNGQNPWSAITSTGQQSWGEVLAWNWDYDGNAMITAVRQWEGEKSDWINRNANAVTGHYTMMINPNNSYVGLGSFASSYGGWSCTAGEFTTMIPSSEADGTGTGAKTEYIEVAANRLTGFSINSLSRTTYAVGETVTLKATASARLVSDLNAYNISGAVKSATFTSSNTKVATVNSSGVVTFVGGGTVKITAKAGNYSKSVTLSALEPKPIHYVLEPVDADGNPIVDALSPAKNHTSNKDTYIAFEDVSLYAPTKKGYTFKGWYLDKNYATKIEKIAKGTYKELTVYAKWAENKYTLTFDMNSAPVEPTNVSLLYTQLYALPGEDFVDEEGYCLMGWNTKKDGSGTAYALGAEVERLVSTNKGTKVLYAQYSTDVHYVTFDANGGRIEGAGTYVQRVVNGKAVRMRANEPERANYLFAGWYADPEFEVEFEDWAEGQGDYDFDNPEEKYTKDFTVYAKWDEKFTANAAYITDLAGNVIADGDTVEEGSKVFLKTSTLGGTVYYTCDGSEPTKESATNNDVIVLSNDIATNGEITIKMMAGKTDYKNSEIHTLTINLADHSTEWGDVIEADRAIFDDDPSAVPMGLWVAGVTDQVYTGSKIKLDLRVYDHKTLLTQNKDYKVSYVYNTKAADKTATKAPKVTVTGIGNYKKDISQTFTIQKASMDTVDVADVIEITHNGKVKTVSPTVKIGTKKLEKGIDYDIVYPEFAGQELAEGEEGAYQAVGEYTVLLVAKDKSSLVGDKEITMAIIPQKLFSKVTVEKIATQKYTDADEDGAGDELKPAVVVKDGRKVLKGMEKAAFEELPEGEEKAAISYTYTYFDNREVGKATVRLEGQNAYKGSKEASFKITGSKISNAIVGGLESQIYTGEPIIFGQDGIAPLSVKYVLGGVEEDLEEGIDYTITYPAGKNIKKGTATLVINGIGRFSGSVEKSFIIKAYNFSEDADERMELILNGEHNAPAMVYAKGGAKIPVAIYANGTVLKKDKDYTLEYSNYKNVYELPEGVDFADATGKIPTVTIKGKGNYKGTVTVHYEITPQDISSLKISVKDIPYQNKAGIYKSTPTIKDVNKKALEKDVDYNQVTYTYLEDVLLANGKIRRQGEVVSKKDIIPKGTWIVVTVSGKDRYSGTISDTFRITKADLATAKGSIPSQLYTGKAVAPGKDQIKLTVGTKTLTANDYDIVGCSNNINVGKATVTLKGKGNYGGTLKVTYKIKNKSILETFLQFFM